MPVKADGLARGEAMPQRPPMDDAAPPSLDPPRAYLVVLDGSAEARVALRFAARRAAKTGGTLEMLAVVEPAEFVQWGGVQEALDEEARLGAEALLHQAAGEIVDELGVRPTLSVVHGDPAKSVRAALAERPGTAALVLGAADGTGGPGALVEHFTADAGGLPCPLMIVPGGLDDAALDRLS
jgi:nucleotide-binding universal stress UspA family protein